MANRTKFNISDYVDECVKNIQGYELLTEDQLLEEQVKIKNELKTIIETDYDYCKSFNDKYSNFNEVVDTLGAVIVNTPQLEFYNACVENSQVEKWKNSRSVEDQSLYWLYYLKNTAEDKDSQQQLYERTHSDLIVKLNTNIKEEGGSEQDFINIQIDGLDNAAVALDLMKLVTFAEGQYLTAQNTEQNTSEVSSGSSSSSIGKTVSTVASVASTAASVVSAATSIVSSLTEDINSKEEQQVQNSDSEDSKSKDYYTTTTTVEGTDSITKQGKYYYLFTAEEVNEYLNTPEENSEETTKYADNWIKCSSEATSPMNMLNVFPPVVSTELNEKIPQKLVEYYCKKLLDDIKEQCELVQQGLETQPKPTT